MKRINEDERHKAAKKDIISPHPLHYSLFYQQLRGVAQAQLEACEKEYRIFEVRIAILREQLKAADGLNKTLLQDRKEHKAVIEGIRAEVNIITCIDNYKDMSEVVTDLVYSLKQKCRNMEVSNGR